MKIKAIILLVIAAAMMMLITVNHQAAAQEIISENLFENPGWESGYYNQDNIAQIAVPNGWRMHWLDNVAFEGTNGLPAYRPETVVWNIEDAPERERSVFFRDGSYTLKIFKGWAPLYAGVSQDVSGLEVGRKYRIAAPIYIDIVQDYEGGKKNPPWNAQDGFVRFGAGPKGAAWLDASQINYSPYWTAENVNPFYLSMPLFVWDFVATSPEMTVFIEMGSRYPHNNNGFFMDGVGLYATDQVDYGAGPVVSNPGGSGSGGGGGESPAAAAPTVPPVEVTPNEDGSIVHVVGPGDSFWTIAIKYASVLEMPPEEALPYIQELNGSPQFVSAGQELIIREAGDYGDTPPPAEEAPAEGDTGEETPSEEAPRDGEAAASEEDVIIVEGEDVEEVAEEAPTAVATAAGPSGICVSAFNDNNANGLFDGAPESMKADAAITLFKDGKTVTTYITDGVKDIHCFDNLEKGTYQVQLYPPANYQPTTADSWAVSVTEGVYIPLEFGMQYNAGEATEAVAEAGTDSAAENSEADTAVAADEAAVAEDAAIAEDGGGLMANLGGILVIVAVILVLVAGAGVVMLRRG